MADELDKTGGDLSVGGDLIQPEKFLSEPGAAKVSYPRLEMVAGPAEGLPFALVQGEQILGRSREQAAILLEDTSVSRLHVKMFVGPEGLFIQDLGSRNGTYVNGRWLKKDEKVPVTHLDQIKIGIYIFRLTTRPLSPEELEQLRPKRGSSSSQKATYVATPEKTEGDKEAKAPSSTEKEEVSEPAGEEAPVKALGVPPVLSRLPVEPLGVRLKVLFFVICIISGLAGVAYFAYLRQGTKEKPEAAVETAKPVEAVEEPSPPAEPPAEPPAKPAELPPPMGVLPAEKPPLPQKPTEAGRPFHAFLDIQSKPMAARIQFGEKFLGTTPLKAPVTLEPDKEYELIAEFDLKDVRDKYQQRQKFAADVRKEVIPVLFDAELGSITVMRLPRHVDFYLEGYYAYDKLKSNPVKITRVTYGQPVYVPYGHYLVELREKVQMASSQTFVDEIRYRREFDLEAAKREIELSIADRDLQFFPASIRSVPSGSTVYLDGEKVGVTPFSGELPLGKHELKLTREGFFDYVTPLDMRTNTSFEATIELKTSKAGELVNKARELKTAGQYQEAIGQLVEALKLQSSEKERAEIHLLMGEAYYLQGNLQQAAIYFEQAKSSKEFYYSALMGLSRAHFAMGATQDSLTELVEIFLNIGRDDPLKREANALFKQISPLKSVLYVSSEPAGALVFVNGREVEQKTPVILSDLSLGNYRLEIQKPGYSSVQVKQNLKLGEFVPIIVTLKPENL